MGSAKLLATLMASLFSFPRIQAGPCVASSSTSPDFTTSTPTSTTTPVTTPSLCTLSPKGPEEIIAAPSQFYLAFETCDGSYDGTYRVAGAGNDGEWIWDANSALSDQVSLDSQGNVIFGAGLLIAAQPTELDHDWVSWINPNDATRADWSRPTCHAAAVDGSKYLRCTGIGPTYVHFQLCDVDSFPRVYLAPEVKPGCKETNLVIIEIIGG